MKDAQMIPSQGNTKNTIMYMALELSNSKWKIMFSNGFKRRQKTITAGDLTGLQTRDIQEPGTFKPARRYQGLIAVTRPVGTGFGFIAT